MHSLKHLIKTTTVFFRQFFPQGSLLGRNSGVFFNNMEMYECRFLTNFRSDNLFGSKVACAMNQHLQSLFRLCSRHAAPVDFDPQAYSFNEICTDIIRYRFFCALPPSLEKGNSKRNRNPNGPGSEGGTGGLVGSGGNPNDQIKKRQRSESKFVRNEKVKPEWKLSENEDVRKMFNAGVLDNRPSFNATCKLCHRWASKGFCFDNCFNKDSHCEWSEEQCKAWTKFQTKCRAAA